MSPHKRSLSFHLPAMSVIDVHFKWNCQFHQKDSLLNSINEDKISWWWEHWVEQYPHRTNGPTRNIDFNALDWIFVNIVQSRQEFWRQVNCPWLKAVWHMLRMCRRVSLLEHKRCTNKTNKKSTLLWHQRLVTLTLRLPNWHRHTRDTFSYKLIPNVLIKPHHFWHFQPFYKFWFVLIFTFSNIYLLMP